MTDEQKAVEEMAEIIKNTFMSKDCNPEAECRDCEHLVEPQDRKPLSDCDRICKKYKEGIVYYDGFWKCWQCLVGSEDFYKPLATALYAAGYRKVDGNTSDGYHTFNELYHHRAVLFAMICNQNNGIAWKSKKHNDGTMFDGMFIVGIETPQGQATYHYDILPYWDFFKVKELKTAPIWDGHTPSQAIDRILEMSKEATGYRKQSDTVNEFAEKVVDIMIKHAEQHGYDPEGSPYYTVDVAVLQIEMGRLAEQYGKEE